MPALLPACLYLTLLGQVRSLDQPYDGIDPLESAQANFDNHNYKAALEPAEAYLKAFPAGPHAPRAAKLRVLSLLGLRQWDDGVAAANSSLADYPQLTGDVELHSSLARVGERIHKYRALAIEHNEGTYRPPSESQRQERGGTGSNRKGRRIRSPLRSVGVGGAGPD